MQYMVPFVLATLLACTSSMAFESPPQTSPEENVPAEFQEFSDVVPIGLTICGHIYQETEDSVDISPQSRIELLSEDDRVLQTATAVESGYYAIDGISAGTFRVRVTTPDLSSMIQPIDVRENTGQQVLNFVVSASSENAAAKAAGLTVNVFENRPEGKVRRTDASILLWKGEDRQIIEQPDVLSGSYETTLAPGLWQLTTSLPGLPASSPRQISLKSGATSTEDIVFDSETTNDEVSALVAVLTDESGNPAPEIHFVSPEKSVAAVLEAVSQGDLAEQAGTAEQGSWKWFWARPGTALEPGNFHVKGTCAGFNAAETASQPVGTGTTLFQITFRPPNQLGTVSGTISQQVETEITPLANASILLSSNTTPETRQLVSDENGEFSIMLPPGEWWASVEASGFLPVEPEFLQVEQNESTEFGVVLGRPESPAAETEANLAALIAVLSREELSPPGCDFVSDEATVPATTDRLTDEELQEIGLESTADVTWYRATTEAAVKPGIWQAVTTLGDLTASSTRRTLKPGSRIVYHLTLNPAKEATAGRLVLNLTNEDGEPVANASVRIWHDDNAAAPYQGKSDANGQLTAALSNGLWWAIASHPEYQTSRAVACSLGSEETTQSLTLNANRASDVSVIVSAQRQWARVQAELPQVEFAGNGAVVPGQVVRINPADVGGGSNDSSWDWFEVTPATMLEPGSYTASGTLDQYTDDATSISVSPEQSTSAFLTLRLSPTAEPVSTELSGQVLLIDNNETSTPVDSGSLVFTQIDFLRSDQEHDTSIETGLQQADELGDSPTPITVPVREGTYNVRLTAGVWSIAVLNENNEPLAYDTLSVGEQPQMTHDLLLFENTPEAHVEVILEVLEPLPELATPQVEFLVITTDDDDRPREQIVNGIVNSFDRSSRNRASWFVAQPADPIPVGAAWTVLATAGERYRAAETVPQTVDSQTCNTAHLTLHPIWEPPQPARLAGQIISDQEPPLPIRNALLAFKNEATGQLKVLKTDDGSFDLQLPAGRWRATVKTPECQPWRCPQLISLPEGSFQRQDLVVPVMEPDEVIAATDIRIFIAVESGSLPVVPEASILLSRTVTEMQTQMKNTPQGIKTFNVEVVKNVFVEGPGCEVHRHSPAELNEFHLSQKPGFDWFLAIPREPVPPGFCAVDVSATGYELAQDLEQRFVQAGLPTIFEATLVRYLPAVEIAVTGSDNLPRSDINIRLVNRDIKQSLAQAAAVSTDTTGAAFTELDAGIGNYNILISGDGIEPQAQTISISQQRTTLNFRVFNVGEMKVFSVSGNVVSHAGDAPPTPVANATVILEPFTEQPLPASVRPLKTPGDGQFNWQQVPTGTYSVTVRADGFQPTTKQVVVDTSPETLELILRPSDPAFAEAMRKILVTGWGTSPEQREIAEAGYREAKQLYPNYVAVDLAMALNLLNADRQHDASRLLETAPQTVVEAFGPEVSAGFGCRADELLVWLHLLMHRYEAVDADLQAYSQTRYATEIQSISANDTAHLMGIASGVMLGPRKDRCPSFTERKDLQIATGLADVYQSIYITARDSLTKTHTDLAGQVDTEKQAGEQALEKKKAAELADIDKQLDETAGKMEELKNKNVALTNKANQRIQELQTQIQPLLNRQDAINQQARPMSKQIENLKSRLNSILSNPDRAGGGGGGGIGGGGFGGGGGGFGGDNPGNAQAAHPNFCACAECERQVRTELFSLEKEYNGLRNQWEGLDKQVKNFQADQQTVRVALQTEFQGLDAQYRQLEALQRQLNNRKRALLGMQPANADDVNKMASEMKNLRSYYDYPLQARRKELLESF